MHSGSLYITPISPAFLGSLTFLLHLWPGPGRRPQGGGAPGAPVRVPGGPTGGSEGVGEKRSEDVQASTLGQSIRAGRFQHTQHFPQPVSRDWWAWLLPKAVYLLRICGSLLTELEGLV